VSNLAVGISPDRCASANDRPAAHLTDPRTNLKGSAKPEFSSIAWQTDPVISAVMIVVLIH
jgi:hypothetical protein